MIDQENERSVQAYVTGIDIPEIANGASFPLSESYSGIAARTKATQIIQPEHELELGEILPGSVAAFKAHFRSILIVPLISQGDVVATFWAHSKEVNAYDADDVRVAESVASQIAGAIANSQQFSKTEQMEQESSVLAALGRIIN